jgi:DNA gyrase subunit A
MRLHQLTGLEREKLEEEFNALMLLIADLKSILADDAKLLNVIREEFIEIKKKYGDERRTEITAAAVDIDIEDLIDEEDIVVTISNTGYVKRMPMETYRAQNRGGKGVTGMKTKEEDFVKDLIVTTTHAYLLFFTNLGRVHWLKAYNLPDASRHAKGKAIINLIQLQAGEEITAAIPIREFTDKEEFLVMATKKGLIKKTNLKEYSKPRKNGVIAITLNDDDSLVDVKKTNGAQEIVIASKNGLAIHFEEEAARAIGRTSKGVIGIRLKEGDEVIGMDITDSEGTFLVATENGYGKRTKISAYRLQGRGGKGVINIKTSDRNGKVIGVKTVDNDDEIILVTEQGMVIRQRVGGISVIGRNAQGVRLIKMNDGDKLVGLAKIEAVDIVEGADIVEEEN